MAYAMTKQGSLDNCITYEFICDTVADMNAIEDRYRSIGSVAIVLQGESDGLEVYIAGSDKNWNSLSSAGAGADSSATGGLSIYICGQAEVDSQTGLPDIDDPDDKTIYLVPAGETSGNLYEEYIYVDDTWEKFGSGSGGSIDVSNKADVANPVFTGSISLGRKANTTVGENSTTLGSNLTASGAYSHAEGYCTAASAMNAHAEGEGSQQDTYNFYFYQGVDLSKADNGRVLTSTTITQTPGAHGQAAHSEGYITAAMVQGSHTEGKYTFAGGQGGSHAEGISTFAAGGGGEHAEGYNTYASSNSGGAHAEGKFTMAWGSGGEHAEGQYSFAAGSGASHAEGYSTAATNTAAHSEGYHTRAHGYASHAEGDNTTASTYRAHSEGYYTQANGDSSHAEGGYTQALQSYAHAEGYYTTANGSGAHAEGYNSQNNWTTINGIKITQAGLASGTGAHSEGYSTVANTSFAHSEGYQTAALAVATHSEGYATVANAPYSHSENFYTLANASYAHAEGYYTIANGDGSHVGGTYNVEDNLNHLTEWVSGTSYSIGDIVKRTFTDNNKTTVRGYKCKTANNDITFNSNNWYSYNTMNYAEIIGNGTADNARSNARALDWNGNEYLMGDIYVGCNADSTGGTKLARIPDAPSTDGTYMLQCVVSSGVPTYTWISAPNASGVSY